jgi:hypothetical protein
MRREYTLVTGKAGKPQRAGVGWSQRVCLVIVRLAHLNNIRIQETIIPYGDPK